LGQNKNNLVSIFTKLKKRAEAHLAGVPSFVEMTGTRSSSTLDDAVSDRDAVAEDVAWERWLGT